MSNIQGVLSYLIGPDWTSYFDVSIVDAKKPLWFVKGTVFRQIDTATGTPKIGVHQGLLKKGDVYAGGMCSANKIICSFKKKKALRKLFLWYEYNFRPRNSLTYLYYGSYENVL